MTLPPWNPKTDKERRAFIERVHDELMSERMKDGAANAHLLDDMMFRREAARRGYPIKISKRGPRSARDPMSPLEQAKHDAKRLGLIFQRLWNHRNRHSDPSVAAILTDIWDLSEADREKLELHLSHKPKNG
jgi:hypothetical protein